MLGRVLESIEQVVAPDPTLFQSFEFNWKLIKNFYNQKPREKKGVRIDDTNIPYYLEQLLKLLIKEEQEVKEFYQLKMQRPDELKSEQKIAECMNFVLDNKPLDLLVDLAINEQPVGIRQWILKWMRRYLTCLENPVITHGSVFKPIIKLITVCNGNLASPYESDEILFLEAVAGWIGKIPEIAKLFIPAHQFMDSKLEGVFSKRTPKDNQLFCDAKVEPEIRRVSLMVSDEDESAQPETSTSSSMKKSPKVLKNCNCTEGDRFTIFDAVMSYIESADSRIVVRACESILILIALRQLNHCAAVNASFTEFSHIIGEKLFYHADTIPDDMELGDIEDCNITWGLFPKDHDQQHFIGRYQLTSYLCWLDFADCLCKDNFIVADMIGALFRESVLEKIIEPNLLESSASFGLVVAAKTIKQIHSESLMEEMATWLVGTEINGSDCLLNILIENAQDNPEILLQTLQFVESLLDNPNERIMHSMIFIYVNSRGYVDLTKVSEIESWSDEEDQREKRRGSIDTAVKSKTLAPNNILRIINNFLLLLPRQLMAESVGTCYEEYMQDASRHYQQWIKKTKTFRWPIEASSPIRRVTSRSPTSRECSDSGISEEFTYFEGPLLRLLFNQVRNMGSQPYELNLASIAILSKLALLPHPYLHEILLSTEIPVAPGASTLFTVIQSLSKKLLAEIPRCPDFSSKIRETAKRLLTNPPLMKEAQEHQPDENDATFEALIVLEEFCKELAAIAFIKYHHATE